MSLPRPYLDRDGVTIYHGDAYEILPALREAGTVDVLVTDPPYEIEARGAGLAARRPYFREIEGFTDGGFDPSILSGFPRWAVFCGKEQLVGLLGVAIGAGRRWMLLTWNKPNPTPLINGNYLPDTEYIVHAFPGGGALFGGYEDRRRWMVHAGGDGLTGHPNEKPVPVMAKVLRSASDRGEAVCDPFMGSGTTLVAARDLGRRAIGIEREEHWCEVAARRLSQQLLPFAEAAR